MSDLTNNAIVDNLKDRLDELEPHMDRFNHQELVADVARLVKDNDWAAAEEIILMAEQDWALVIATTEASDQETMLAEDTY